MTNGQSAEEAIPSDGLPVDLPVDKPVDADALPWRLVRAEETWTRLVVPYLEASIELVLQEFVAATTDTERTLCQGRLQAFRSMLQAPGDYEYLQKRIELQERKTQDAKTSTNRRRSKRPVKRRSG